MNLLILFLCFVQDGSQNIFPSDVEPFTTSCEAMYKMADQVEADPNIDVRYLLKETHYEIHADGRKTTHWHYIYQIMTQAGLDSWGQTEWTWSPWYQNKPSFDIRAFNRDGLLSKLDPESIQETTLRNESNLIYTDRRVLRTPIPGAQVGSIVEETCTIVDAKPFFPGGASFKAYFHSSVPAMISRVILTQPTDLSSQWKTILMDPKPTQTQLENGKKRLIFELKDIEPWETLESSLPYDQERWPHLAFSSSKSWNDVAVYYSGLINQQLDGEELPILLDPEDYSSAHSAAVAILDIINENIRYTGLEFGENSIIPHSPRSVFERKYGDCKDKALLLASSLRHLGYEADLALILAGYGQDVNPDFPGLKKFNHVIVYVDGEQPLWIDPTSETSPIGTLPSSDEGRWTLIANVKTQALVKVPISSSARNITSETREYKIKDNGKVDIVETTVYIGIPGSEIRSSYCSSNRESISENLLSYVKDTYTATSIESFDYGSCSSLNSDFTIEIKLKDISFSAAKEQRFSFPLSPSSCLSVLPKAYFEEKERKNSLQGTDANKYIVTYLVTPPKGFSIRFLPDSETLTWGPYKYSATYQEDENSRVVVEYSLDMTDRLVSVEDIKTIKKAVKEMKNREQMYLLFEHNGQKLIEKENYKEALALYRAGVADHPGNARFVKRLANTLLSLGLKEKAKQVLLDFSDTNPDSSTVYSALGWILQHNDLGQLRTPGYEHYASIEAYLKAIELDPEDWETRTNLAILYEYDALGIRYSKQSNMQKALDQYSYVEENLEVDIVDINIMMDYLYLRQFDELMKAASVHAEEHIKIGFSLLCVASKEGFEKAMVYAKRYTNLKAKQTGLELAAEYLLRINKFQLSSLFFRELAKNSPNSLQILSRADVIMKVHHNLENKKDEEPAILLVKNYYRDVFLTQDLTFEALAPYMSKGFFKKITESDSLYTLETTFSVLKNVADQTNFPLDSYILLTMGMSKFKVVQAGQDSYRVQLIINEGSVQLTESYYIKKQGKELRIIGNDFILTEVGEHILSLLKKGDIEVADTWLNWINETPRMFYPRYFPLRTFSKIMKDKNESYRRYAAASLLLAEKASSKKAYKVLKEVQSTPVSPETISAKIALMYCLDMSGKYKLLESLSTQLSKHKDYGDLAEVFFLMALKKQRKFEEGLTWLKAKIEEETDKDKLESNRLSLAEIYAIHGQYPKYQEQMEIIIEEGSTYIEIYNSYAWNNLFCPPLKDKVFEYARKASSQEDPHLSSLALHTLACLYAERGNCKEALNTLKESIKKRGLFSLGEQDYYIIGRVLEQYGFEKDAEHWYRDIKKPDFASMHSVYQLAQNRLKIMMKK